jgi:transposase-like protein
MILSAIAERLKRRSKGDFKGRHFEASLILQAISWYLRYPLSTVTLRSCSGSPAWRWITPP